MPEPPAGLLDRSAFPAPEADAPWLRAQRDAAMQAAQDAVRAATRLTRLLTVLSEPASLDKLLDRSLAALSELFTADVVALLTPDEGATFRLLATLGLPETMADEPVRGGPDSHAATVMRDERPVVVESVSSDPRVDERLHELGVEAAVWLPVRGSQTGSGVLMLGRCEPTPFAYSDVELLTAMAHRLGLALEQGQRSVQLERLVRASQQIARHLDEDGVLDEAVDRLVEVLSVDGAAVIMVDQHGIARFAAQRGLDPAGVRGWSRPATQMPTYTALATGEPYYTPDLQAENHHDLPSADPRVRSILAVPLRREGRVQGVLCAHRYTTAEFAPDTVQLATLFAGQVSAALENARLYRAAREEELALRASEQRFRALVRSVSDVIAILAADGTIRYTSPAATSAWGLPPEALPGSSALAHVHADDLAAMRRLLDDARQRPGATLAGDVRLRHAGGAWRDFQVIVTNLLADPAVKGIVATYRDVTERKAFEQKLTNLVLHDPLSGLANRVLFMQRLEQALARADHRHGSVAVLFIDLDNFKVVNDSLGHDWGDKVLVGVADRLRACLRQVDTAARLGGDEFTVLLEELASPDQAVAIAERIGHALRAPLLLEGREIYVGASIGIALNPARPTSAEDVLREADLAMYRAKSGGKGRHVVFEAELSAGAMERLELEIDLRRGLERGDFRVYYQPIVELADGRTRGLEALARWEHPERGLISPAEFIPLAEETGLIVPLGQWVLEEACREVRAWQRRCPDQPPLVLSVNLSARQFEHPDLVADVARALRESGLDPRTLSLEITETVLMKEGEATMAKLRALKGLGVQLAIDDFGTGYSSLAYLKRFPVDALKIDKSFVDGIDRDPRDAAIVRSMVALAAALDLRIVGEGIERPDQAARLGDLGCQFGQGYLFARPAPAGALATWQNADQRAA